VPFSALVLFLLGKCQCHKDTDMEHTHRKPAAFAATKLAGEALEFLRPSYHGAYRADGKPQHE